MNDKTRIKRAFRKIHRGDFDGAIEELYEIPKRLKAPEFIEYGLTKEKYSELKSARDKTKKRLEFIKDWSGTISAIAGGIPGGFLLMLTNRNNAAAEFVGGFFFGLFLFFFVGSGVMKIISIIERRRYNLINAYESDLYQYEFWQRKQKRDYWRQLDGHSFERAICNLFVSNGYSATLTKGSGDGGVDIIINEMDKTTVVQCKNHVNPVGPGPIRELYGVMNDFQANHAIFISPNGYTQAASNFGKDKPIELWEIQDIINFMNNGPTNRA